MSYNASERVWRGNDTSGALEDLAGYLMPGTESSAELRCDTTVR